MWTRYLTIAIFDVLEATEPFVVLLEAVKQKIA